IERWGDNGRAWLTDGVADVEKLLVNDSIEGILPPPNAPPYGAAASPCQ
ncbi:hypothetical protein Tco_1469452, partial [Tanacetum coccineum]